MHSGRLVKDIRVDTSATLKTLRVPIIDIVKEQPLKGNLAYDRASEVNNEDGILYYAGGVKWIPLLSGLGNNLVAGPGISIVAAGGNITISNTSPASSVTLTSLGGSFPLVPSPDNGPNLGIFGLNAGAGITLTTDSATEVTITNSSPASSVTLASAGGTQSLVVDGTGPSLSIKGLSSDPTITLTPSANDVTVSVALDDQLETFTHSTGAIDHIFQVDAFKPASARGNYMILTVRDTSATSNIVADLTIVIPNALNLAAFRPVVGHEQYFSLGVNYDSITQNAEMLVSSTGDITIARVATGTGSSVFTTWGSASNPFNGLTNTVVVSLI